MYLLCFDAHYPEHSKPSWEAVFEFMQHNRVDGFVWGGDNLNCESISRHNREKPLYRQRGAFKRDLDGFDRDLLSRVEKLLPKGAEKLFLLGNHEDWLQQLWESSPELEGLISVEGYLDLKRRGWKVIPQGGFWKCGHLHVLHGDTLGGGQNSAKKAADVWSGCNVVCGHFHTLQQWTKASPAHLSKRWTATVLPTMGTTAPAYGKNHANTHLTGFGILEVRPDGNYNLFPVVTVNGAFSFGGRTYSGKKRGKSMEIEGVDLNIQDDYPTPHEIRNRAARPKKAAKKPVRSQKHGGRKASR